MPVQFAARLKKQCHAQREERNVPQNIIHTKVENRMAVPDIIPGYCRDGRCQKEQFFPADGFPAGFAENTLYSN